MIEEALEVAAAVMAEIKAATMLWEQYKSKELTREDILAHLKASTDARAAKRAAQDAAIAALPK